LRRTALWPGRRLELANARLSNQHTLGSSSILVLVVLARAASAERG
jgi:hypothetical protein